MGDKFWRIYRKYGSYIILAAVFLYFAITQPTFLKTANIMNVLQQVAIYGIVATGVTFVMISGGTDLSVGGQVACNGLLMAAMMVNWNIPVPVAMILGVIVGVAIGCLNGLISAYLRVTPFVITLCTMLILNGLALVVTNGYPIYDLPESFLWLGQGWVGPIPVSVIILVLVCIVGWFLLSKTYFGRTVYALGGNQEAARLAGINTFKLRVMVYGLCGLFTTIGTMVMLARTNMASATAGQNYQFDCLTAACLGGVTFGGGSGSMLNTFIGVLIIGILQNGLLLMGVNSNMQQVIKGCLLLFAIAMGAIQKRRTEKD